MNCCGTCSPLPWYCSHIIGRVDDMEHLIFSSLTPHLEHDFLINIKIDWSKNVMTETQSSPQVVLGSMDERLCPLAHLGMYFSVLLHNAGSIPLLPDALFQMRRSAGVPFCQVKKEVLSSRLRKLFGCCLFCKLREGLLGSHNVRKGACTYCRSRNVSLDNTNQRGRWRGRGSQASMQIGTYTNTSRLSFPDAPPSIKARIREYVTSKLLPDHSMGVCVVRVPLLAVGTEQASSGGGCGVLYYSFNEDEAQASTNIVGDGRLLARATTAAYWWYIMDHASLLR